MKNLLHYASTRFTHANSSLVRPLARGWRALLSNPLRSIFIKKKRDAVMRCVDWESVRHAVVFLVPGMNTINGGIMSIISIATESRKILASHDASVFVCTSPGDPPLFRYTRFQNNEPLLDFNGVLNHLPKNANVMFHIPELYVPRLLARWRKIGVPNVMALRINVLLQNIDLCPNSTEMQELAKMGALSCTTAHAAYATREVEQRLGCPLYHLSTGVDSANYKRVAYADKEQLIVYSPDADPRKKQVILTLRQQLSDYQFVEICGISYEGFKNLIARARFSITFGEGMDGYFIEPIFSGAIGCAVFNTRFFPGHFKGTDFVYDSWDELIANLVTDIRACEDSRTFTAVNERQFSLLSRIYSFDAYRNNITLFYEKFLLA